jgi:hypothetical protein
MKPTIALFLHQPRASVQCGNSMLNIFADYYRFKIFTKHEIERNFFDDVDIVAFPGGIGDAEDYRHLLRFHGRRIRRFVDNGGRYLGICMGAYWAGKDYFNILQGVDAVQYIKRPRTDTRRPHTKACPVKWQGQPTKMFFYDGCALVGDRRRFQTVATYANGDAMAIYQNRIGLIGCHPESEDSWYQHHSWMRSQYHDGEHHKLLLDFTNDLLKR